MGGQIEFRDSPTRTFPDTLRSSHLPPCQISSFFAGKRIGKQIKILDSLCAKQSNDSILNVDQHPRRLMLTSRHPLPT